MVTIHKYQTPDGATDSDFVCRSFAIRASLIGALDDWLEKITYPAMWEQVGDMTPEEVGEELEAAFAQLQARGCAVLIGEVKWLATAVPDWCLLCDGTEYDNDDYPELATALDAAYATSPLTFKVPDLIFRSPRGAVVPGGEGGADSVTLTLTELPEHDHGLHAHSTHTHTATIDIEGAGVPDISSASVPIPGAESTGTSGVDSTGGGEAFSIQNPYHDLVPVIAWRQP